MSTLPSTTTSVSDSSIYTLETADERKMRFGITAVAIIALLGIGFFFLPRLTQIIHNWIDFGIAIGQLFLMLLVIGTIFVMRNVLIAWWKTIVRRLTRMIIKTNLPDMLEVVVSNRRQILAQFNDSIKKMMMAINLHDRKMAERKDSMQKNLDQATYYQKQVDKPAMDQHQKEKALDQAKHFGREAAEDKKLLESMQADREKMHKSYNFFDRLYSNLENSTASVANTIGRLRDQLQTSETWRAAAKSASGLLGVSEFESITLEETRNRIVENEAEVMMMIHDHETLLNKMEAENGIMDDAGQELLEQYSKKVDVYAFMKEDSSKNIAGANPMSDTSWLTQNENLLK